VKHGQVQESCWWDGCKAACARQARAKAHVHEATDRASSGAGRRSDDEARGKNKMLDRAARMMLTFRRKVRGVSRAAVARLV